MHSLISSVPSALLWMKAQVCLILKQQKIVVGVRSVRGDSLSPTFLCRNLEKTPLHHCRNPPPTTCPQNPCPILLWPDSCLQPPPRCPECFFCKNLVLCTGASSLRPMAAACRQGQLLIHVGGVFFFFFGGFGMCFPPHLHFTERWQQKD